MASAQKQIQQLARQFYKLSFANGAISSEQVAGVLEYIEKHRPAHAAAVLKAYYRLVAAEIARGEATVEHAGPIQASALNGIAAALSRKYGRAVTAVDKQNDSLIAGVRVRIGDDLYESSVAGQLAELAEAV
ncbi:MAG: F0F1 ATP synthase subunit delta [Opitutus sp.]